MSHNEVFYARRFAQSRGHLLMRRHVKASVDQWRV